MKITIIMMRIIILFKNDDDVVDNFELIMMILEKSRFSLKKLTEFSAKQLSSKENDLWT